MARTTQQQQPQHGPAGARAVRGATVYYYSEGYPRSLTSKGFTGLIPVGRVGQRSDKKDSTANTSQLLLRELRQAPTPTRPQAAPPSRVC